VAKKSNKKTRRLLSPKLRVAFDTNVLFTDVAHHLLRMEVKDLIEANSSHDDLILEWYLPKVVVGEREYQMQRKAIELYNHVTKLEKLLGHQLTTEKILRDRIRGTINDQISEFRIKEIEVDTSKVEWSKVINSAVYREPPFDPKEKEKGFRDAIIAESFMQLVSRSPATPRACRLAFVSDDRLLRAHLIERTKSNRNVRILEHINELEDLINTLVSDVPEETVKTWRDKAGKFFFEKSNKNTMYYREEVGKRLAQKYFEELEETPTGNYERQNGTWYIGNPVFQEKKGQRIHWMTPIAVEATLYEKPVASFAGLLGGLGTTILTENSSTDLSMSPTEKQEVGKGTTLLEVYWSVSISAQRQVLSRGTIEGDRFIETDWGKIQTSFNFFAQRFLNNLNTSG